MVTVCHDDADIITSALHLEGMLPKRVCRVVGDNAQLHS